MDPRPTTGTPDVREDRRRSPWGTIAILYVSGVVAAMSIGKFASVGPEMAGELGLSLSELGWVISAVVGVGAVAGLPAGYLIRRVGTERSMAAGLVLTAAAGAASVAAGDFAWLLAARGVEGAGYLLVSIAAPVLILRLARERDRGTALSIWATFVPVAIGASTLAGGVAGAALGWRGWTGGLAALTLLMAPVVWARLPRGPGRRPSSRAVAAGPRALTWPAVLAGSFCVMVLVTIPVVVLLPTFLIERHGHSPAAAGALTSVISLLGVPGGLAVGVLFRRGAALSLMAASGLLIIPAAWLTYSAAVPLPAAVAGAAVISVENGFLGALVFAVALPLVLRHLDHADLGTGLVAQMGSLGSLIGPPLFGLVAARFGYPSLALLITTGMLVSTAGFLLVARRTVGRPSR
ncbi:MFS transporter [Sphaerisporangium sp. B11E5]|uniref:MFS transporter n=1 Tax=Sphaerisporangium sp. B11E5 TaxID=3153563 RepID=UPI00325EE916